MLHIVKEQGKLHAQRFEIVTLVFWDMLIGLFNSIYGIHHLTHRLFSDECMYVECLIFDDCSLINMAKLEYLSTSGVWVIISIVCVSRVNLTKSSPVSS